jgi:uncharacterized protein YuzE
MTVSYTDLTPGGIPAGAVDRTIDAGGGVYVDIGADRAILGVEVIGERNWLDGLAALAMQGRLAVLPRKDAKPSPKTASPR